MLLSYLLNTFSQEDAERIQQDIEDLSKGDPNIMYEIVGQVTKDSDKMYSTGNLLYSSGFASPFYSDLVEKKNKERARILKGITIEKSDIPCGKCSNREVIFYTLQLRRSDEPPSTIYKCLKCPHIWREG
jgi:DNA-directed RNA polymerase subunit M/transcription elongation factor TFIIS